MSQEKELEDIEKNLKKKEKLLKGIRKGVKRKRLGLKNKKKEDIISPLGAAGDSIKHLCKRIKEKID